MRRPAPLRPRFSGVSEKPGRFRVAAGRAGSGPQRVPAALCPRPSAPQLPKVRAGLAPHSRAEPERASGERRCVRGPTGGRRWREKRGGAHACNPRTPQEAEAGGPCKCQPARASSSSAWNAQRDSASQNAKTQTKNPASGGGAREKGSRSAEPGGPAPSHLRCGSGPPPARPAGLCPEAAALPARPALPAPSRRPAAHLGCGHSLRPVLPASEIHLPLGEEWGWGWEREKSKQRFLIFLSPIHHFKNIFIPSVFIIGY